MKLTPAASTRTRTSPLPGSATSTSRTSRTSGPPLRATTRAFVRDVTGSPFGSVEMQPVLYCGVWVRRSVQAGHLEALAKASLAEAEAGGHGRGPAAQELLELVHVRRLRDVRAQGGHLALEGRGDVHGVRHVGVGHDPDL